MHLQHTSPPWQPNMTTESESRSLSEQIAGFIVNFALETVPPPAIERARIAFIDTLGVMLAGSREDPAAIVRDMVALEGAHPVASIVGTSQRASPQLAALANGVASHALDFDLTCMQGQLTASLIPALLPVAESRGATPREMIAAFIIGFEVASHLSRANPNHNGGGAWHGTGTIGTIAAAAASARLLKVPASAIPDVIGIAVSLASGVNANYGTMTKPLHAGQAARNGITAALLGMRGFSANRAAIEGRGGFAHTFARDLEWHTDAFKDLGTNFDLAEQGFQLKRYPCGGVIHTAIDAALLIRQGLGGQLGGQISAIHAGISNYAANRANPEYPTQTEAAKFNLQYVIGFALANGSPKLDSFAAPARDNPRVKELAQLVSVSLDPEFADARTHYPTRLRVTLSDGRVLEEVRYQPSGAQDYPLSTAQIEEKFLNCATQVIDNEAAGKLLALLREFGEQSCLGQLWPLLQRSANDVT
ncbi:MAG: 2-methylcitrate dehydratase PrpD [Gammaproteobacteria bacterium]|jgi:2-methylcitrate dehydratase PrpD